MARSNVVTTAAMVAIGGAVILGAGAVTAGCSSSNKEAPSTTPTTSSSPARPSPSEKGIVIMPPKAFNPNLNAADGILALQSQGYIVQINNGGGYTGTSVLSNCKIAGVDGLRGDTPPANTTVFLTLACPNSNN